MDIPGLEVGPRGRNFAKSQKSQKLPSASIDSFEALQNCPGHRTDFTSIYYMYIPAYIQSYVLVYIIQVYIRTAWNDFYDHSQNNALALVSLTDLRLKYQQLLFGLTTFCLFKGASLGTELKVPRYPFTQVPKLKVTQLRDICHKFTAATSKCQDQHHHQDHHRGDDRLGRWEGRDWGGTSFSPRQLEYNGFTGEGKIGLPPTPSKLQFPQHRCLYQLPELEFKFCKSKHC